MRIKYIHLKCIIFTLLLSANFAQCDPPCDPQTNLHQALTSTQLSEAKKLIDDTSKCFFSSAIYDNSMYAIVTRMFNAEFSVLEKNSNATNANQALNNLIILCKKILNCAYSEQITLTQLIMHMQTVRIGSIPLPFSKEINYDVWTLIQKKINILQAYNAWLARAINHTQKDTLSILVRNFNLAITDNDLPEALWFIYKTMEDESMKELNIKFDKPSNSVTIEPTYNDILTKIANLDKTGMEYELLHSMFATYTIAYRNQITTPFCIWTTCKCNLFTIGISIFMMGAIVFFVLNILKQYNTK